MFGSNRNRSDLTTINVGESRTRSVSRYTAGSSVGPGPSTFDRAGFGCRRLRQTRSYQAIPEQQCHRRPLCRRTGQPSRPLNASRRSHQIRVDDEHRSSVGRRSTDLGNRRIIPITGGHFRGPLLDGGILNNGADWQVVTAEGTTIVDTRYLRRTHDNSLVYLRTYGFRLGPPQVLAETGRRRIVEPDRHYVRINLQFETAADNLKWLEQRHRRRQHNPFIAGRHI